MTDSTIKLDIYWSFRSPYSYLAIDRLSDIAAEFAVDARFRPVRPLALREPDFFEKGRKQFLPYLMRDVMREAERLGIPFALPSPDPIVMDMETGKVAPEQPNMNRIMALAVAAVEHDKGLAFARSVSHRVWTGKPWADADALAAACNECGLEFAALDRWLRANTEGVKRTIDANETAQLEHHWGVPLMVLDGEPFFGQDRLDSLLWRLEKLGLSRA